MRVIRYLILIVVGAAFVFTGRGFTSEYYIRGLNFYLDGEISDALSELERAYEQEPSRSSIVNLYAEVLVLEAGRHYEQGREEEAFELIQTAKDLKPEDTNIAGVYKMLHERLHPEETEIKEESSEYGDVFEGMKKEKEEKRIERVEIVKEPPEKITVREMELLRPILLESESNNNNNVPVYVLSVSGVFGVLFIIITALWFKKLNDTSRRSLEAVVESSREKMRLMEREYKRRRKEDFAAEMEEKSQVNEKEAYYLAREEKLKKEYEKLLSESFKTEKKPDPRLVPEPEMSETKKGSLERKKIFREFRDLKRTDYGSSISLLKNMISNSNPWVRMWGSDLALELDTDDALKIIKALVSDREYQVKKAAFKALEKLSQRKISMAQKNSILRMKKELRRSGWVG